MLVELIATSALGLIIALLIARSPILDLTRDNFKLFKKLITVLQSPELSDAEKEVELSKLSLKAFGSTTLLLVVAIVTGATGWLILKAIDSLFNINSLNYLTTVEGAILSTIIPTLAFGILYRKTLVRR